MHRFALRNGVPYINWIVTDIGLKNIFTALTVAQIDRLSAISQSFPAELAARQLIQIQGETFFQGERISPAMVERQFSRLCLQCFQEAPFHRMIWDLLPVSVCPVHGSRLTHLCPKCGAKLHWRRNHLARCPSNHELSNASCAHTNPTNADLAGVRLICEWVGLRDGWEPIPFPWTKAELPVGDLMAMLELLGRLAGSPSSHVRRYPRSVHQAEDYHLVLAKGYEVALGWPKNFHELLDQLSEDPLWLANSSNPMRRFLHSQLSRQPRPTREIIGREVWSYAASKKITLSAGAFGFTPSNFDATFISSSAARRQMQVSTEVLHRIAHRETWMGHLQLSTRKFTWLLRSDVDGWCREARGGLSATRLARRFHVSQSTILRMAGLGLFGCEARDRKPAQFRVRWHALPDEAQGFINALRSELKPLGADDGTYVNWSGFTKRPEARAITISDVLSGIVEKKIKALSMDGERLPSLRFHLGDALMLCRAAPGMDGDSSYPFEIALPLRQISEAYHVEHPFLMRAITFGLVHVEQQDIPRARYWIKPSDMEHFLNRFTTIGLLARRFQKSAPSISGALRRLGVKPYRADPQLTSPKLFAWDDLRGAGIDRILAASKDERSAAPSITPPGADVVALVSVCPVRILE